MNKETATPAFSDERKALLNRRRRALWGEQPLIGIRAKLELAEYVLKRAQEGGLREGVYLDPEALLAEITTERPEGYEVIEHDA